VNEKIEILKEIQETNPSHCPICTQELKNWNEMNSNFQELKKQGNVQSKNLDFQIFHLNKEMERVEMEMKMEEEEKNKISKELENVPRMESNSIQRLNELHSREMKYSNHLLKLKYEMEKVKNDSKRIQRIQDSIEKIKKENEMENYKELDKEIEMLEFWATSFQKKQNKSTFGTVGTLRSFLLEESILDLNQLLKEYSEFLNSEKTISFDKELNLEQSDYGKRSSGQRKRNDLVILFALFDLVKQKGKFKSNFLCLDEVFDALDFEGKNQIHQLLNVLSQKIQKIFIISHSSEMIKGSKNIIKTSFNSTNGTSYEF
jgi:DNA repair exonuclease SbcCD ATPase subunit